MAWLLMSSGNRVERIHSPPGTRVGLAVFRRSCQWGYDFLEPMCAEPWPEGP